MTTLVDAIDKVMHKQSDSGKPLAVILAGHNGSGKSTMWRKLLAPRMRIALVNADRMMLSILPEPDKFGLLPGWATDIRDNDKSWMRVAQKGVESFVKHAMQNKVPFAMETVFSYWEVGRDGVIASKIDKINEMHEQGYFVLLCFVGLTSDILSIGRVETRVSDGGHNVPTEKLIQRFPRTQKAIAAAVLVADASILVDNSLDESQAFSVCRVQLKSELVYDIRQKSDPPPAILGWLQKVCPTI